LIPYATVVGNMLGKEIHKGRKYTREGNTQGKEIRRGRKYVREPVVYFSDVYGEL
jgi:hypothetical protein